MLPEIFSIARAAEIFVVKLLEFATEEQPSDPLCRQPEPAVAAGEFADDEIPERNCNLLERFIDQLEIGRGVFGDVLLPQQAERRSCEFFAETAQPVPAAIALEPSPGIRKKSEMITQPPGFRNSGMRRNTVSRSMY